MPDGSAAAECTRQRVPREPTSAELARRFIEAALDAAKASPHIAMPGDVASSALGLVGAKLAMAAKENICMRRWLARETESMNRQIRGKQS